MPTLATKSTSSSNEAKTMNKLEILEKKMQKILKDKDLIAEKIKVIKQKRKNTDNKRRRIIDRRFKYLLGDIMVRKMKKEELEKVIEKMDDKKFKQYLENNLSVVLNENTII